ncbi:MAG: hypothetical protein GOVbin2277_37 [Prokaryotic dsDNA virus sp.]|nr:MAG: hypothetical protein GOVbin2277_37 [Prokaryotic dsDNA virus sp.]
MNVSLGMLRRQLYAMRAWDSSGKTQDSRIRDSLNAALARMASDVPQAIIPDEEHVVLRPDVLGTSESVASKVVSFDNDKRLLKFVDSTGLVSIADSASATTWRPTVTGEWDMIMHIEVTDADGRIHRRQCLEFFIDSVAANPSPEITYAVTLDRPFNYLITADNQGVGALDFRLHQPEFFVDADVMEIQEPARIFDGSRQQVWKIDTAGAGRQDMLDFEGNSTGRPYRCWRGRHVQLPAPTEAPRVMEANATTVTTTRTTIATNEQGQAFEVEIETSYPAPLPEAYKWSDTLGLRRGKFALCYTYVMGRKDEEWQLAPSVTPGGDVEQDSSYGLTWAYNKDSAPLTGENIYSGIHDPQFESAPSPIAVYQQSTKYDPGALIFSATNIDAMQGFGDSAYKRYGRSGYRIRYYIAQLDANERGSGRLNDVETNLRFHLLCEVEPTFDMVTKLSETGLAGVPDAILSLGEDDKTSARVVWTGRELYDYHRPLRHSTGYYAWKVYPHQDARYELDFRVLRLPNKYIDDQDTAAIHPEAVPTLIELALYYVSLVDGNDQLSAQAHMERYLQLVRVFRDRYGNPGGIVEPVSILGYSHRHRYGTFSSSE